MIEPIQVSLYSLYLIWGVGFFAGIVATLMVQDFLS